MLHNFFATQPIPQPEPTSQADHTPTQLRPTNAAASDTQVQDMELEERQSSNEDGDHKKTQIMKVLLTAQKHPIALSTQLPILTQHPQGHPKKTAHTQD